MALPFTSTTSTMLSTITTMTDAATSDKVIVMNPSTAIVLTTKTIGYATTLIANQSPTVTIVIDPNEPVAPPGIVLPVGTIQPTATLTHTLIEATYYQQDLQGQIYSTSTTAFLYGPSMPTSNSDAHAHNEGFDGWSTGAKAGLIVGVVFAALILLWLCICCHKRRSAWIAHDWRWAPHVQGGAPGLANRNLATPGSVMSPVSVVSTPSYHGVSPYAVPR
jgi:hypothetical protein